MPRVVQIGSEDHAFDAGAFQRTAPLAHRRTVSAAICAQHPDCVPIILERMVGATAAAPAPSRNKLLVPRDANGRQLLADVRKALPAVSPHQPVFLFVGQQQVLVPLAAPVAHLFEQFAADDGFLYVRYSLGDDDARNARAGGAWFNANSTSWSATLGNWLQRWF